MPPHASFMSGLAFDPSSGVPIWESLLPGALSCAEQRDADIAIDPSGGVFVLRREFGRASQANVSVVVRLDPESGSVLWTHTVDTPKAIGLDLDDMNSIAVARGRVFLAGTGNAEWKGGSLTIFALLSE